MASFSSYSCLLIVLMSSTVKNTYCISNTSAAIVIISSLAARGALQLAIKPSALFVFICLPALLSLLSWLSFFHVTLLSQLPSASLPLLHSVHFIHSFSLFYPSATCPSHRDKAIQPKLFTINV